MLRVAVFWPNGLTQMRPGLSGRSLLLLLACLCGHAGAHSDAYVEDPAFHAPHGGQMRTAGPYHLGLIAGKGEIIVYVTDHRGAAVTSTGGKGKAVVHTDGRGTTVALEPGDGNVLSGKGRFKLKRSSVVYVTVDLRRTKPQKAVFRPLEAMPAGSPAEAGER
jgi:hypothetical protein